MQRRYLDPLPVPAATRPVDARIELPGSKSITNRVLPIAALATGRSTLHGVLDSDDTRYMVEALEALGFDLTVDWEQRTIQIEGQAGQIPNPSADLFLGNSGTSMRFLTALCALGRGEYRLDGTDRMRQRPIGPLLSALRDLGVDARSEHGNDQPPIIIRSNGLEGGVSRMRGDLSSQYFSALAMVMPCATSPITVEVEGDLVSKPYIDLTVATMRAFGVDLQHDDYRSLRVAEDAGYTARQYTVEPDASAASYFFALAAITGGRMTVAHLPWTSAQGDIHFVDVLEEMGCSVERGDEITVIGSDSLLGVDVDMNAISDTVMTLAAIAPFASGPTVIRNVEHIRHKETDRLHAVATELNRMGVRTDEERDSITIYPGEPQPATIETYDDHRMAMAFALTGVRSGGVHIADPGCVSKTVPEYWDLLFAAIGETEALSLPG